MKKGLLYLILLTVWILPSFAAAETGTKQAGEKLDDVVVTAGRTEELKREVTSSMTVITQQDIKQSTARDLGELLFKTGNVWVRQYPGALTPVSVRGFRSDTHGNDLLGKVLVLLNGRRAGTGNVAKIKTKNIERIEILRGPASVQYGSAGMGGTINVITKRGKDTPEAFVEAGIGSDSRKEAAIGGAGKNGNLDFSGAFSHSETGDFETADGTLYENTGIDSERSANVNIGYNLNPANRIGLIYNSYEGNGIGDPGGINSAYKDPDDYKDSDNSSLDLMYDGGLQDGSFSWMTRFFNGKDKNKWVTEPNASSISENQTDQQGAQAQLTWDRDTLTLTGGVDWLDYRYKSTSAPTQSDYENAAGFVMGKLALVDRRLIITGGVRYDDYDVLIGNNQGGSQSTDNATGNMGLAFQVIPAIKLRAAWGQGFRMPGANQLAGNYASWGSTYLGNPDLDPETSNTLEGGIDLTLKAFNASITYFHTEYEDFIQTAATSTANTYTYENVDNGTITGFEWEASLDFGRLFEWEYIVKPYFKGTWFTKYEDDSDGSELQYIPESTINYGITVEQPGLFSVNLNFAYYGEENVYDWNLYADKVKDAGTVADLSATYVFLQTERGDYSVKGEISNLLDEEVEYVNDYPNAGRTFFIGFRWDY